MMRTNWIVCTCLIPILFTGCSDNNRITNDTPTNPVPAITGISPDSARFGVEVIITGTNFGATPEENTVTFNGMEADILDAEETELIAEVPRGAGSGTVAVTVAGQTVAGPELTYLLSTVVSTLAGTGQAGDNDGPGQQAQFNTPMGISILESGGLAIADYSNQKIRRITLDGEVETLISPSMTEKRMSDFLLFPDGSEYLAPDVDSHVIYSGKVSDNTHTEIGLYGNSGYNDGPLPDPGNDIRFNRPISLSRSPDGKKVYITDRDNHCIRAIDYDLIAVTTFAGTDAAGFENGSGTDARFNSPEEMTVDAAGNLYIADRDNHSIRKVTPEGETTTIAGGITPAHRDGPVSQALFHTPKGVAVDVQNNIYVADYGNNSIRMITPDGEVNTLVMGLSNEGFTDGVAEEDHPSGLPLARINGPAKLAVDENGTLYFSDVHNHAIRRITFE